MTEPYTTIVGLEIHVQLLTESKLFCGCSTQFGLPPNSATCPVCLGLPGSLPVMNCKAFDLALRAALALNCQINRFTKWDRKNYYYPDLPKNYQISQYDLPICQNGEVPLYDLAYPKDAQKSIKNPDKRVRLIRIHLEEDVAKSFHFETTSGIRSPITQRALLS